MEGFDHFFEFADLLAANAGGTVASVGGEVAYGVVAPVVVESGGDEVARVDVVVMNGEEFYGGDAEAFQMGNCCGVTHCGVAASKFGGDVWVFAGEAAHVDFVDDGAIPRDVGGFVVFPVEGGVDDDGFGHEVAAVGFGEV